MLLKKLETNYKDTSRTFFIVGISFNFLAMLLHLFGAEIGVISFFKGLLTGISVPLLMISIYLFGKSIRESRKSPGNRSENK